MRKLINPAVAPKIYGLRRRKLVRVALANCVASALEDFADCAVLDDGGYSEGKALSLTEQEFIRSWISREAHHFYRSILDDESIP